jgi:hypothetical protein
MSMKPIASITAAVSIRRFALIVLVAFFTLMESGRAAGQNAGGEFVPLFPEDGEPAGWVVRRWNDVSQPPESPAVWTVRDGVLESGKPRGSWLMCEKEYGDFVLEFEFKLGPLGNSGLALRAPMKGDPAFDGMELQMADFRYNTSAKDSELTGGLYRAVAPKKQVYKPTEWNRYEVTLQGTKLRVVLNGEQIHDIDLAEQELVVQRHDGSDVPPIEDRPRRGHIGFQDLSRGEEPVLIRNARIKVLD